MQEEKRIELTLGQDSGEFRLIVNGIAIAIHLTGQPSRSTAVPSQPSLPGPEGMVSPEDPKVGGKPLSAELDHYRQISREIYEGLGKLAKDINISIQDLNLEEIVKSSTSSPGDHLNQAKNQVTDVLLMTEKATMNIMDLVEAIREDCQVVQKHLSELAALETAETGEDPDSEGMEKEYLDKWSRLLAQAEDLNQLLRAPAAPPDSPLTSSVHIPLSDVLQIVLEFCANETVKQHLKAVQAKQDAIFKVAEAERALSLMAAEAPQEEGFFQLPVEPLLNLLKSHCIDERVKELFTKMGASVGKLFPVSALPLEGQGVPEVDFPEVAAETLLSPEVAAKWEEFHQMLKGLSPTSGSFFGKGSGAEKGRQATEIIQEVQTSVDRITGSLSRIIEALCFQDLSGQRLLKILNLLRQVQVQILALLVMAGQRFQWDQDGEGFMPHQQAREELDRLLQHNISSSGNGSAPPSKDQPLDQDAINEILTSMGF